MEERTHLKCDPLCEMPIEIVIHVFEFLDFKSLLTAGLVSKGWYSFANDPAIWRGLIAGRKRRVEDKERLYSGTVRAKDGQWKKLWKDLGHLGKRDAQLPIINSGVDRSSCDGPTQDIDKTLDGNPNTFWSGTGSADPESPEHLTYMLKQPICVVNAVRVKVYAAGYQVNKPTYAPKRVQICVGFGPKEMHWKSPVYNYAKTNAWVDLPVGPEMVIGGFVRVDLLGRTQLQPGDELYYVAIEAVGVFGRPLGALWGLDALSDSLLRTALTHRPFLEHLAQFKQKGEVSVPAVGLFENDEDKMVEVLKRYLQDDIAPTLERVQAEKEIKQTLKQLLEAGSLDAATRLILRAEKTHDLRTKEIIRWIRDAKFTSTNKTTSSAIVPYCLALLETNVKLNAYETIQFVKALIRDDAVMHKGSKKHFQLIASLLLHSMLTETEKLGDLFYRSGMTAYALIIYRNAHCIDKIVECLIELGEYRKAMRLIKAGKIQKYIDFASYLRRLRDARFPKFYAFEFALILCEDRDGPLLSVDEIFNQLQLSCDREIWVVLPFLKKAVAELKEQHKKEQAEQATRAKEKSQDGANQAQMALLHQIAVHGIGDDVAQLVPAGEEGAAAPAADDAENHNNHDQEENDEGEGGAPDQGNCTTQ